MESRILSRRILVLGARGFLGEHVVQQLAESGCEVLAAMRPGSDWGLRSPRVATWEGNFCDVSFLRTALDQADAVIFTAGRTWQPGLGIAEYHQQNVGITERFFDALGTRPQMRVVFTSSMATMTGSRMPTLLNEDSPRHQICEPLLSPYTRAKIQCERLALDAAERGNQIVILNPGQLFGPGAHSGSNLHSTFMALGVCQGKAPFYVHGGTTISDVRDVARAHVSALTLGRSGQRYILGGHCVERQEFYRQVIRLTGVRMPHGIPVQVALPFITFMDGLAFLTAGRIRGPAHRFFVRAERLYNYGCSEKAAEELKFAIRPMEQTLLDTLRHFQERGLLSAELGFLKDVGTEDAPRAALLHQLAKHTAYARFLLPRLLQVYQVCQSNAELRGALSRLVELQHSESSNRKLGPERPSESVPNDSPMLPSGDRKRILEFLEYLYFASDEFLNWVR